MHGTKLLSPLSKFYLELLSNLLQMSRFVQIELQSSFNVVIAGYILGAFVRGDSKAVAAAAPHMYLLSCQILVRFTHIGSEAWTA